MTTEGSNNESLCLFLFLFFKKLWPFNEKKNLNHVKHKRMSLHPVSALSEQNLGNKSRVTLGSLEFVVMFRAPGGILRWKGHREPPHVLWKIPLAKLSKQRLLMDIRNLCCNSVPQWIFFYLEHFLYTYIKKKKTRVNLVTKVCFSFYIKSKYISPIS